MLIFFTVLYQNANAQTYCTAGATSTAFEKIGNVTFSNINNTSTSTAGYEDFTSQVASVFQGISYPISITISGPFAADQSFVWIDFNNNGVFTDAGELVYTSANGTGPHTGSILIPAAAATGLKRMRVRMHDSNLGPNTTSCGTSTYGQVEDYTVNITLNVPCTGTPAPGNTISNQATVCAATPFTLSLQTIPAGTGVTYQWQSSTLAAGPWANITGATNLAYTGTLTAATFYQCLVTCSGNVGTSTPVQVALTPASSCYCASNATNVADEDIFNVTLGSLNNSSTCTSVGTGPGSVINRYSNYTSGTGAPAAPDVFRGATNPISIGVGTCGGNFTNSCAVWVDLNQDGAFTAAERVYVSAAGVSGPHVETGNLVIPATALLGITRMRVVNVETGTATSIQPCGTYLWGETEDYNVNIVPCVPVVVTNSPSNATIQCSGNATFTAAASGSIPSYRWQFRPAATAAWQLVPAAAPYSNVAGAVLSISNASVALNGYQYRAIVSGGCSSPDPTGFATLTVNPLVLAVVPAAATICNNTTTPVLITVPNTSNTVVFSSTFPSPPGVLVPDNGLPAGISTVIPVSGIPVGANILKIEVKFTMTHTYVGDMVINLKAPNATATTGVINLVGALNGGTGTNATANFTNTTITSDNTAPVISGVVAPRTGTFKADALLYPATFGPVGGVPNVNNWASLTSANTNANGNWGLFMVDLGPGDVGNLTSWSISITYGAAPAFGTFTPVTGLFTNATATTAYVAGTAVTQVYALPTATTTYTAAVSTATCNAVPSTTVVTVNTPAAGTLAVANNTICAGSNTTFSFTGLTAGTGLSYQWQMSTDGGATFTPIAGATAVTLPITGATTAMSGNRYRVLVTSASCIGTLTSGAGTLVVNPNPVVTLSAAPITKLFPGLTTIITAAVSPNAAATYTWYRNGVVVPNVITNKMVVNVDALGIYSLAVTDVNGCSTTAGTSTPSSITISDSSNTDRLFIYPSPNNGNFQVRYFTDLSNGTGIPAAVNVYDSKGSMVFSQAYRVGGGYQPMNVSISPAHGRGIFRVDLVDTKGNRLKTGTVVIF